MAVDTITPTERPVAAAPEDAELVRRLERLAPAPERAGTAPARLVAPDGQDIDLPPAIYEVLRRAAHQLAAGMAVSIVPVGTRMSTQQVADLLGVSRPHVVKLLEAGKIPFTKTGRHRRVLLTDVLAYRDRQAGRRSDALDRLAERSEDLPLT